MLRFAPLALALCVAPSVIACSADAEPEEEEVFEGEDADELEEDAETFDDTRALGQGGGTFNGGRFLIATDFQPESTFDAWVARGVNTLIRCPHANGTADGDAKCDAWTATAASKSLSVIRSPKATEPEAANIANVIAWHWGDEPEWHPADFPTVDRAKAAQAVKNVPIHLNVEGHSLLNAGNKGCFLNKSLKFTTCYPSVLQQANWVSEDLYACGADKCQVGKVGDAVKQLRKFAGKSRAAFAYIETGDEDGKPNPVKLQPKHIRSQVFQAVINGARGVLYFPVATNPVGVGGCPGPVPCGRPDMPDATKFPGDLTELNQLLTRLGPALQNKVHKLSSQNGVDRGWRTDPRNGNRMYIASNSHDKPERVEFKVGKTKKAAVVHDGNGKHDSARHIGKDHVLSDTLGPYESRVYLVNK